MIQRSQRRSLFGVGWMGRFLILAALAGTLYMSALPASAASIVVTPADAAGVKKAIAGERGHVVVVNFWATWCGPCVAEFPALVKLQKDYKSRGLVVFAISADSPRDLNSKVKPFLVKAGADFPQFLQNASDPDDMINAFDPKWQGDLPRTFIYDKRGRLVKELSGEQTQKSFAAAVKPLLGAGA